MFTEDECIKISVRLDQLQRTVEQIHSKLWGNGKPSLEEKIMANVSTIRKEILVYVDQKIDHSKRNADQSDCDLHEELTEEKVARNDQHKDNVHRFLGVERKLDKIYNSIKWAFGVGTGMLAAAKIADWLHLFK